MVSKTHQLTLYSLGQCYRQLNKRFEDKPLEISISKVGFIELLLASKLVGKKKRAIYKNLELLEKKKLVSYDKKQLCFTRRGYKLYNKISASVEPYIEHRDFWESGVKVKRKLQAVLKS